MNLADGFCRDGAPSRGVFVDLLLDGDMRLGFQLEAAAPSGLEETHRQNSEADNAPQTRANLPASTLSTADLPWLPRVIQFYPVYH